MKTLIRNGTVITASKSEAGDILITDSTISAIGSALSDNGTDRVIDAKGMYIFPGGVDPHVHMHLPAAAGYSSDDFLSGSRAALYGGTTSIIDFVTPARGESLTEALGKRLEEAKSSLADYALHVSPVEWRNSTAEEISECIRRGVTSFKVYMAYKSSVGLSDDDLVRVMETAGEAGGLVTAHCEMGDEIEELRNRFIGENSSSPRYHASSRPASLEAAAVRRAIELAEKTSCPLYIVHVSSKESLRYIRQARSTGQRIFAETCPQYLILDDSKYQGEFDQAAPYVISPPLRKKEDNEALWDALSDGTIDTVGTDHCPFMMSDRRAGMNDFRKIPGGAGGVEHRLALLYTYGVLEGRMSLSRMADLFSAGPAKMFGLWPRKGDLKIGSDADLVIWNPMQEKVISIRNHHQNCDTNIYEGMTVRGNADFVIAGGRLVIENGKMTGAETRGKYLFRTIID